MKELRSLITNTTSLVGYIAILMFAGAYVGGDQSYTLDPTLLKGSVMEGGNTTGYASIDSDRSILITIDGRQYQATVNRKISKKSEFPH